MLKRKGLFLLCLCAILCCACATNVTYKTSNYTGKTFTTLVESSDTQNYDRDSVYDRHFPVVKDRLYPFYQLVYHHAGGYTTDEGVYYVAVVEISGLAQGETTASWHEDSLPVAVKDLSGPLGKAHYVNILLSRKQLIDSYKNWGKMVISLTDNGEKHNIVFSGSYLKNVLTKTTNFLVPAAK